jgi:hypothetical protein
VIGIGVGTSGDDGDGLFQLLSMLACPISAWKAVSKVLGTKNQRYIVQSYPRCPAEAVGRARPSLFGVSLGSWGSDVNGKMAITYSVKRRSYFARECPRWYQVAMLLLEEAWNDGEVG